MLTENKVVEFVAIFLKKDGYIINNALQTTERGIDIVATHPKKGKCFVEVKGETSSKKETSRYGKPFNKSQVKTHIGAALLKSFQIKQENENSKVCIAVSDNNYHREIFNTIRNCLSKTSIKFLFVKQDGSIDEN